MQLNRVTQLPKKGEKVIVLELTDIQLHSNARPTQSVGGAIRRSIENNKPGRIFSSLEKKQESVTDQNSIEFSMPFVMNDPVLKQTIHDYQKQGYRVMIQISKSGLPIHLGKDAVDFMNSTRGKRILRKIEKDKDY
ncbi:MAG TPA: hypothetical protein P5056_01375 [Candidatus Paceibacterota bacterium]|nr:hypothetical protein [Candidatus Paceibacterota bacterium]